MSSIGALGSVSWNLRRVMYAERLWKLLLRVRSPALAHMQIGGYRQRLQQWSQLSKEKFGLDVKLALDVYVRLLLTGSGVLGATNLLVGLNS